MKMLSGLEQRAIDELRNRRVSVESGIEERRLPLQDWPWKTGRSRKAPTVDLYLPDADVYVEVKGFMTIYAMAKMAWLAQHPDFRYYVLQLSETDWEPRDGSISSSLPVNVPVDTYQFEELAWLRRHPEHGHRCNRASRDRLAKYIKVRTAEFQAWTGRWP